MRKFKNLEDRKTPKHTITICIDASVYTTVKSLCAKADRSFSWFVGALLKEHILNMHKECYIVLQTLPIPFVYRVFYGTQAKEAAEETLERLNKDAMCFGKYKIQGPCVYHEYNKE